MAERRASIALPTRLWFARRPGSSGKAGFVQRFDDCLSAATGIDLQLQPVFRGDEWFRDRFYSRMVRECRDSVCGLTKKTYVFVSRPLYRTLYSIISSLGVSGSYLLMTQLWLYPS